VHSCWWCKDLEEEARLECSTWAPAFFRNDPFFSGKDDWVDGGYNYGKDEGPVFCDDEGNGYDNSKGGLVEVDGNDCVDEYEGGLVVDDGFDNDDAFFPLLRRMMDVFT